VNTLRRRWVINNHEGTVSRFPGVGLVVVADIVGPVNLTRLVEIVAGTVRRACGTSATLEG
jgi:hypothetical protein